MRKRAVSTSRNAWVWFVVFALGLLAPGSLLAGQRSATVRLDRPLGNRGTLAFLLKTTKGWANGFGAKKETVPVLQADGLARAEIRQSRSSVALIWRWQGGPTFQCQVPEWPGPETWSVQVTWDARAGRYDVFVNGLPLTTPGTHYDPWRVTPTDRLTVFPGSAAVVEQPRVTNTYLSAEAARRNTPDRLRGRHARLFGQAPMPPPLDLSGRLGKQLADVPLDSPDDVQDWVMEGPGRTAFKDGWMRMWSARPDASGKVNGHIVFWCPQNFPDRFVCEWDVQILSDYGLTIVFFAAKGAEGQDIFDPSLPPRDGTFAHYIRGAINSYHISYYANTPNLPGRTMSNLRKNNQFYLLATGPVAIPANSKAVHHMRLVKDGAHIQLCVDGRVSVDYTDPGTERYGPVYRDGKIGLRQMQWTAARYRNFRVWELRK